MSEVLTLRSTSAADEREVHRFRMYDARTDEWAYSTRWATKETIQKIGADIILYVGVKARVDAEGFTNKGFSPPMRPGRGW